MPNDEELNQADDISELQNPDFLLKAPCSTFRLLPLTDTARRWVERNEQPDRAVHPDYPTLMVECKEILGLLRKIRAAQLTFA